MFVAVLDDFDLYLKFIFVDMSVHILMMYLKFDVWFVFFVFKPEYRWKIRAVNSAPHLEWENDLQFLQWERQQMVGPGTEQRWMAETKLWICPTIFLHSSYSRWNLRAVDEWAPSYWTWPALERRRFAVVDTSVMKKFISKLNIVLMPCFKVWPLILNLSHWVSALSLWWPFFSSRGSEYLAWWTWVAISTLGNQ